MNGRKKLLYVMGIDWNWIFQRPQIIEQHLEEKYDVTVVFPRSILKGFNKARVSYPLNYRILWNLPLQEKNRIIGRASSLYSRRIFRDIEKYDLVVIGYPLYYRYIPEEYTGNVIYDCMDNFEAIYPDKKNALRMVEWEKRLVSRSDIVFVSATRLKQKICTIAPEKKIILVRNGSYDKVIVEPCKPRLQQKYSIGYFGTIAEWFDFELLRKSLKKYPNIEYHLIGPMAKPHEQEHQGIVLEGIVPHHRLYEVTRDFSCFIMPFVINDVVEWVDPVKLYEYISMGKCIISVRYKEIQRFEDYVYMYSTESEFIDVLGRLIEKGFPPKYTKGQQEEFLRENTWGKRFEQIDNCLEELLKVGVHS